MNIREAILKAADWIETNPGSFQFINSDIPECGTKGCAAGWIGYFRGISAGTDVEHSLPEGYSVFQDRMDELVERWWEEATTAAITLREYADAFYPDPIPRNRSLIPLSTLAILDGRTVANPDAVEVVSEAR